jgi:hypothetical protein
MSYWSSYRSPSDVQRENGKGLDFAKAKALYESVKPIRGVRLKHDIRPIGERNRTNERIVKVCDTEYFITNCYNYPNTDSPRSMTFRLNGDMEYLTIHTPHWITSSGERKNSTRPLSLSSDFYFYHYNLPTGLEMYNHRGRKYVKHGDQYYTIANGDVVFQRKVGGEWKPREVHSEVIHHIDRKKAKAVAGVITPLLEYLNIMVDMVEDEFHWGNQIDDEVWHHLLNYNGEPHEKWVTLAEKYRREITSRDMNDAGIRTETLDKTKLFDAVYKDAKKGAKPFKQIAIPLGQLCYDRYRNWL